MGCANSSASPDNSSRKQSDKKENKEYNEIIQFLTQVPLFLRLPPDLHPSLAQACEVAQYKAKSTVIEQGTMGNEFFIIRKGDASVHMLDNKGEDKKVADLKAGDYFGEVALLRDDPRNASIIAETQLSTLKITRAKFQDLNLQDKLQFPNRKAVGAGGMRQVVKKPPAQKTREERQHICDALTNCETLNSMVELSQNRISQMIDVAWKETVPKGKEIIVEGDLIADYFYIVEEGSFEVLINEPREESKVKGERTKSKCETRHLNTVNKGGCFGELALLYFVPRAATVVARIKSVVWVIDRENFKNTFLKVSAEKIREYVGYLDLVETLQPLLQEERKALAEALVEMHFTQGEEILLQGEPGNTFFILYDGEVTVLKDRKEVAKLRACSERGTAQFFGERALLQNEQRNATVKVSSPTAKALALDRDSFNMLLGPLEEILAQQGNQRSLALQNKKKGMQYPERSRERILRKDLNKLGLLGCGGFGTVDLYEHRSTQQSYAMKSLSKGYVFKAGMQESVMNEKNIMLMTNSVFIIKLFECYNGFQTLYFLMEPALGGELYATYNRKGLHGSERHAQFYAAGVVFAFEHLHERHIVYRDLKPENLLLNEHGRPKLADMGLAKFAIGKTYTTCGTPDYFAPELIGSLGHNIGVDWWGLGILIFELMSGHPPFESPYPMQIYSKVMKGINKVHFPQKCQGPCGDLVKALLKKEPSERLAMRRGGTKNIKNHKWYIGFDWNKMLEGTNDVPYKPQVKDKKDKSNFTPRKEDLPKQIPYKDDGSGWDKDFAT